MQNLREHNLNARKANRRSQSRLTDKPPASSGGTKEAFHPYRAPTTTPSPLSENAADSSNQERRVGPSVSRDKWSLHARQKLSKGYVLIVAADKRRANFWMREKGYEMCAFDVARALIASGDVIPTGEHHLGVVYELAAPYTPPPTRKPRPSRAKQPAVAAEVPPEAILVPDDDSDTDSDIDDPAEGDDAAEGDDETAPSDAMPA